MLKNEISFKNAIILEKKITKNSNYIKFEISNFMLHKLKTSSWFETLANMEIQVTVMNTELWWERLQLITNHFSLLLLNWPEQCLKEWTNLHKVIYINSLMTKFGLKICSDSINHCWAVAGWFVSQQRF